MNLNIKFYYITIQIQFKLTIDCYFANKYGSQKIVTFFTKHPVGIF
jgi:hypothetical protein